MALFKVTDIIDGNTIAVSGWQWGDYAGKKVRIVGYIPSGEDRNTFAKNKLEILLRDKQVELKNATKVIKENNEDVIECSVFLNDIDISRYFPELSAAS